MDSAPDTTSVSTKKIRRLNAQGASCDNANHNKSAVPILLAMIVMIKQLDEPGRKAVALIF